MNWNKILDRLDFWHAEDRKRQDATNEFCKVFAPGSYPPILENTAADGFIEGVSHENPEIKEWLEYYLYEAPNMDRANVVTKEGKEYNFKVKKEAVLFLNKNYGN